MIARSRIRNSQLKHKQLFVNLVETMRAVKRLFRVITRLIASIGHNVNAITNIQFNAI